MIILGHIVGLNFAMSEETSVNTHSHIPSFSSSTLDVCTLVALGCFPYPTMLDMDHHTSSWSHCLRGCSIESGTEVGSGVGCNYGPEARSECFEE
jgi:hypothetical protein